MCGEEVCRRRTGFGGPRQLATTLQTRQDGETKEPISGNMKKKSRGYAQRSQRARMPAAGDESKH